MDSSCITEESPLTPKLNRRRDDSNYKSKNLKTERKRRKKLSDRLLSLRSHVPKITNMKKDTILDDAIDYIHDLKNTVESLSKMIGEMEASEEENAKACKADDDCEATENSSVKEEVEVMSIGDNKQWVKIVMRKRRGRFTRLMEAMYGVGLVLTDTSFTASKGAILISSCVEEIYGGTLTVPKTKSMLLEIIRNI